MSNTSETATPVLAHLFMSWAPSIKYVFKDGHVADFVNYRYFTSKEAHVKELTEEIIVHKHPAFYINPAEVKVNPAEQDPMFRLRKMIIDEYLSSLAVKTGLDNNMGDVEQSKLTPTSTTSISAITANGVTARLAALIPHSASTPSSN
jgi:hypothetical protein